MRNSVPKDAGLGGCPDEGRTSGKLKESGEKLDEYLRARDGLSIRTLRALTMEGTRFA
jgi:hypothetical protein